MLQSTDTGASAGIPVALNVREDPMERVAESTSHLRPVSTAGACVESMTLTYSWLYISESFDAVTRMYALPVFVPGVTLTVRLLLSVAVSVTRSLGVVRSSLRTVHSTGAVVESVLFT